MSGKEEAVREQNPVRIDSCKSKTKVEMSGAELQLLACASMGFEVSFELILLLGSVFTKRRERQAGQT